MRWNGQANMVEIRNQSTKDIELSTSHMSYVPPRLNRHYSTHDRSPFLKVVTIHRDSPTFPPTQSQKIAPPIVCRSRVYKREKFPIIRSLVVGENRHSDREYHIRMLVQETDCI